MALNYGTTAIPSDTYTVQSGGTVNVSAAFERSVAVIGGMDTSTGSATEGSVVEVTDPSDAQSKFGDGSELHEACAMLFQNGAVTVHALPVSETTVTENAVGTSGTLSNVPLFDTNIHDEHSITFTDTTDGDLTVNIVYDSPPSTPTASDTVAINPVTGEFEADAAATGQYDVTYDYGDYSSSEIQKATAKETRIVLILTETEAVVNDLATELDSQDDDFVFQHGVAGAAPVPDTSSPSSYTSGYSDGLDDERITIVSPPRGFIDDAETDQHRTMSAVAGYLSSLPLGLSATNDSIGGLTGLRTEFTPSQAGTLRDNQVMPLIDWPPVTIVQDMTTSTTQRFERVYAMQVIDEVTELSHAVSREFVGDQQTAATRNQLRRSHRNFLKEMRDDSPPLIDNFAVNVTENSSNSNQTDVELGIEVVGVMDTIDVTITVGDIVENTGAT